jgi:hypothetical protein
MTHSIENPCELWHRILAHINYKALPYVSKAVTGLPKLKVDHEGVCNGCAQGKNIKNPFPKRNSQAKGVLELIHSDVCGPMPSTSISGYVYCVSFIDDYSRKTWVYFLTAISKYLAAQYLYIFQTRREPSRTLQERREYLLDIVRSPRPLEFIYQVSIILRSAGM